MGRETRRKGTEVIIQVGRDMVKYMKILEICVGQV